MKIELKYLQFYGEFRTFLFLFLSLSCPPDLKSPFVFSSSSSSFPLFGQPKTHHHRSSSSQQQPWTDLLKSLPSPLFLMSSCQRKICAGGEEKKEGIEKERRRRQKSDMTVKSLTVRTVGTTNKKETKKSTKCRSRFPSRLP